MNAFKIPVSVLVVIYTPQLDILLLERADQAGFWQSVTGSQNNENEALMQTAIREVKEETGIDASIGKLCDWHQQNRYEIYEYRRHLYQHGVIHNTEHVFGLEVPQIMPVTLQPREHVRFRWLPWQQAAEKCFSPTNREAILRLPEFSSPAR